MDRSGVWQLKRLIISYCPKGGSSRGMREFLRTAQAQIPEPGTSTISYRTLNFLAQSNPQLEIVAKVERNRHPHLTGEYIVNDKERRIFDPTNFKHLAKDRFATKPRRICVKNEDARTIFERAIELRNGSGRRADVALTRPVYSERNTIQGYWAPFITENAEFKIRKV